MLVNKAKNVSHAILQLPKYFEEFGIEQDSRNGKVLVLPEPLTTQYLNPKERVIFYEERDANPFFHFMECLWMMAGGNSVEWISQFNKNIANYSDDGASFYGAYGYRWRFAFEFDQLPVIVDKLVKDPTDRRAVLGIWNAADLVAPSKDIPCNLNVCFRVTNLDGNGKMHHYSKLDMTVFNRSNDMVWGAYGANAVHFSFLQEVLASFLRIQVGQYWQVSNNAHVYLETYDKIRNITALRDPYGLASDKLKLFNIVNVSSPKLWIDSLNMFVDEPTAIGFPDKFFQHVAAPMYHSYMAFKDKDYGTALDMASRIKAQDWKLACTEWLQRRVKYQ